MPRNPKLCPLVTRPKPGCFCAEICSANVESVIRFCMGDFHSCEIYRRETGVLEKLPA